MAKVCLVSCVQSKNNQKSPAEELYISPLFKKARNYAEENYDRWYVLSAKYGLVEPDQLIEPYEKTLNKMKKKEREDWAKIVYQQLKEKITVKDEITFLAGAKYRENLEMMLREDNINFKIPLEGLSIGRQLKWFNDKARLSPTAHVERFYKLLSVLRNGLEGFRLISECNGKQDWPRRGLYFFFEPGEYRSGKDDYRIVRIGTHGVSKGSKSTLWNRIRTHKGTENGLGNHRSSIFRLHVGAAIKNKLGGEYNIESWGIGQSAQKSIRVSEEPLERAVSEHIGNMKILWLSINDEPGPASDRSYIERNAIRLIAGQYNPIDPPSNNWLGFWNPNKTICDSGLWNIEYMNRHYDPRFLDIFEKYVYITIGKLQDTTKSIAPDNWYNDDRGIASGQQTLFE